MGHEIVPKITYASKQRGLVFLDPYSLQVTWEAVTALAKARTFDVFVNFPLMAVTRLLRRNEPPKGDVARLADAICRLATHTELRRELGATGKEHASHWQTADKFGKWDKLLELQYAACRWA